MSENRSLANINVCIELTPDGKYDLFVSDDNSSGIEYGECTLDEVKSHVCDYIGDFIEYYSSH